jgi:hypothetical protein
LEQHYVACLSDAEEAMNSPGKFILQAVGGLGVVAASFFFTLFMMDHWPNKDRDSIRAEHAQLLKAGLEKYRSANGKFPLLPDNPVTDLKKDLVDSKYLEAIPEDPLWSKTEKQYRYASVGPSYGLLFHLESPTGKISGGGTCITGVGIAGVGYWGQIPVCPF